MTKKEKKVLLFYNMHRLHNLLSSFYSYTSKIYIFFNLSPVYVSKLCRKEEYVRLFVLYGDIQHDTDNRQNVALYI